MKLHEVAERLGMEILVPGNGLQQQVTGGCTADLPSEALGRLAAGTVWITSRVHRNAIAVAALRRAAGIVLTNGVRPDNECLRLAETEGVALLATLLSPFEASGRIYEQLR